MKCFYKCFCYRCCMAVVSPYCEKWG